MAGEASVQQEGVLHLTPKAVAMVKEMRAKEGRPEAHALRVAVVGGGCSGFSYQLSFDEAPQEGDHVLQYDGVRVVVDATSAQYLAGTEIDFVSSLHGGGFRFSNPKATHTCGCGSSFSA
jgi:iron-sulfur cluster assembly accessory protein